MNWHDDPEVQKQVRLRSARGKLLRSVIIWMPLFLAALAGVIFSTADILFMDREYSSTWVLVTVLTILAVLFGFQAIQSLLDFLDTPRTERGFVTRRWARSDSFVVRSHYMRLEKRILRGDAFLLAEIHEGDYVEATFYPHSAVLVWADKLKPPAAGEAAPPAGRPGWDGPVQRR